MKHLYIDIGSTYIKTFEDDKGVSKQYKRDFNVSIWDDISSKLNDLLSSYNSKEISICSSANGGLSVLILGLSDSFSKKFSEQAVLNAGAIIAGSLNYFELDNLKNKSYKVDVLVITGGVDSIDNSYFPTDFAGYVNKYIEYGHIVFAGNTALRNKVQEIDASVVFLENILTNKLKANIDELTGYLSKLYHKDIIKRQEIKELYSITNNTVLPTPYIVNRAFEYENYSSASYLPAPFIVIDIGGATIDIHFSNDVISLGNFHETYNRLVFKNIGVHKSLDSLLYNIKNNEFTEEFYYLQEMEVDSQDIKGHGFDIKTLMKFALLIILVKCSKLEDKTQVVIEFERLKGVIITGGACKILSLEEAQNVLSFFYKKLNIANNIPNIVIDKHYTFWKAGFKPKIV